MQRNEKQDQEVLQSLFIKNDIKYQNIKSMDIPLHLQLNQTSSNST